MSMLSKANRNDLITEIGDLFMVEKESWTGSFGMDLAYLLYAISKDQCANFGMRKSILRLLKMRLKHDHPVFDYIHEIT